MARKRKRSGRRPRPPVRAPVTADDGPDWVSIGGRLMFVVGYTPGGVPYGVFEDEMDDLEAGCGAPGAGFLGPGSDAMMAPDAAMGGPDAVSLRWQPPSRL